MCGISMFSISSFVVIFFFFFKQKTAYEMRISDWSSDVCSSDLGFQIKVYQGSTDVSALASYGTVEASGISGAAVDSDGTVTVTGMTAEAGYVEVPITYGGSNVTVRVDYTKVRAGNAAVSGRAPVNRQAGRGTGREKVCAYGEKSGGAETKK